MSRDTHFTTDPEGDRLVQAISDQLDGIAARYAAVVRENEELRAEIKALRRLDYPGQKTVLGSGRMNPETFNPDVYSGSVELKALRSGTAAGQAQSSEAAYESYEAQEARKRADRQYVPEWLRDRWAADVAASQYNPDLHEFPYEYEDMAPRAPDAGGKWWGKRCG